MQIELRLLLEVPHPLLQLLQLVRSSKRKQPSGGCVDMRAGTCGSTQSIIKFGGAICSKNIKPSLCCLSSLAFSRHYIVYSIMKSLQTLSLKCMPPLLQLLQLAIVSPPEEAAIWHLHGDTGSLHSWRSWRHSAHAEFVNCPVTFLPQVASWHVAQPLLRWRRICML